MNKNEFKKLCQEKGFKIKVLNNLTNSFIWINGKDSLDIARDWIDYIEVDINVFHLFFMIGKSRFLDEDNEEIYPKAFDFALNLAIEEGLEVSYEEIKEGYLDKYELEPNNFDIFSLCGECSIKELVD